MSNNKINETASILSAQYNNVITTPGQLSEIRGTGQYSTTNPLSSNWPSANSDPSTSDYSKSLWTGDLPNFGKSWNLSSIAPVGKRVNNQWETQTGKDSYNEFGLRANHTVATALNSLFFNKTNVKYLQKRIIDDVYNLSGVKIKPQNEDAILIIMNNKYQYALYGWLPSMSTVHLALPRGESPCSLTDRLSRLNQSVLQECIKQILSGMNMYMDYYKHASSLPTPLSRPTYISAKGSNVLQPNIGLTSGNSRGVASYNMRNNVIN